jgi:predicted enzyme related to lactoylglutathione lyase
MGAGGVRAAAWNHTSLSVTNLDRAMAFYRTVLGYEAMYEERGMAAQIERIVGLPGLRCDLAQLRSPISEHVLELIAFDDVPSGREDYGPTRAGAAHVAFDVPDLEQAVVLVRELGGEVLGEATGFENGRAVYCREPSGTVLELFEPRPG